VPGTHDQRSAETMADDLDPLDARMLSAALAAGNDEIYDRPAGNAGCQATSAVHVDSSAPPRTRRQRRTAAAAAAGRD